ncbi:hypothetical protein ACIBG8_51460 [Nonomuraea sp. NPDC050556]|uniref:hypothetical protein n=1 Tax=Nonomuraea sp. NPDC050556 TaxID=3364369 RepID=UPI0037A0CA90
MRKRVLAGVLAAAVAGSVLAPAGAALADQSSVRHADLQVGGLTASPGTVTLPRSGTTTVELRAQVRSSRDLEKVVVDGRDFRRTEMVKLERTAGPNGTYSARISLPADARPGEWRFSVEATDARGRTEGADGSFTVKRAASASPRVTGIDGPDRVTVGKHGAKVRITAEVTNDPGRVTIVRDGRAVTLERVGEETYRGYLSLNAGTKPGPARFEVRAYDGSGEVASARSGSVVVRKATTIRFSASHKGGSVVGKGTLKGVRWYGYAGVRGAKVEILVKKSGTGRYSHVRTVTTKRGGSFKVSVPFKYAGKWKAVFAGNGDYAPKASRADRVA